MISRQAGRHGDRKVCHFAKHLDSQHILMQLLEPVETQDKQDITE
jgi:hypothetical protein